MYNSNQSTTEILASEDFIDAIYSKSAWQVVSKLCLNNHADYFY